ncbi:MAG: delta-lactam-biosynthetic de-N-acetylase [Ruminococcaceae bacterium]|nr:delta-lactam-biosynthetic de-N-acetylase [Oscillospiraceae bacterium]
MFCVIKRQQVLAVMAIGLLALSGVAGFAAAGRYATTAGKASDNWGLSFPRPGEAPVGNATADSLREQDAYYIGDTRQKTVYLTFDAGYENGYTAPLLDTLKKHQVPATFFVVGHYLESAPDLVRRMVAEGHTVGNHTYHHPDMSVIAGQEDFARELAQVEEAYRQVTGQEMPRLYRPPQGKYSPQNLQMAKALGYRTYFWSLAYVDWYTDRQPTREQAFDKLLGRIHPGAVVLLHSTSATNAEILDELLTKWKEMGYSFGRLCDLGDV